MAPVRPLLVVSLLALGACTGVAFHESAADWQAFGGELSDGRPFTVDAVLEGAADLDGRAVLVEGRVARTAADGAELVLAGERGAELVVLRPAGAPPFPAEVVGREARAQGVLRAPAARLEAEAVRVRPPEPDWSE